MTPSVDKLVLFLVIFGSLYPQTSDAIFFNWWWPRTTTTTTAASSETSSSSSSSQPAVASNYNLSIGNRVNTNAEITDYGTMLSNININLARFNGTSGILGDASEDQLSELIYGVAEQFRNGSEVAVNGRLAWIDEIIKDTLQYAKELRRDEENNWVKQFPEQVHASVGELNQTTRSCLERELNVEELIQSVKDRSRNSCMENVFQELLDIREDARDNLTDFLTTAEDIEDRFERCVDLQDDFDDEMSDLHKGACISEILLGMEIESLRLEHTVRQRTSDLEPLLYQAKASLLECTADLASYAFNASLAFRQWIQACNARN